MRWNLDEKKLIIGLMSGTSFDAADAALVEVRGAGTQTAWKLAAFESLPFSKKLRERLALVVSRETVNLAQLSQAHFLLGDVFADAAKAVAKKAGVALEDIALIASHGQTVCHVPDAEETMGYRVASTLQIGCAAVIAERTGATVAYDFRARDIAAGGTGAPLVPFADYLLFRSPDAGKICLNVGGIANVTAIPAGASPENVVAFDTGPGNTLLDLAARRVSGGQETCDYEGRRAATGKVDKRLLEELLGNPYFSKKPPKSTGREEFGEKLLDWIFLRAPKLSFDDMLATLTAFTAESISQALETFVLPKDRYREIIASGGGVRNVHLMKLLRERLGVTVRTTDEFGIPVEAKEALAFALLGNETMAGGCGNLPSATGAARAVVLGSIVPGRGFFESVK